MLSSPRRNNKSYSVLIHKTDIGYYSESTKRYLFYDEKYEWGKYSFPDTVFQKIVAWMPVPQVKKGVSIKGRTQS